MSRLNSATLVRSTKDDFSSYVHGAMDGEAVDRWKQDGGKVQEYYIQ